MQASEFDRQPVAPERLEPARRFAGSYAGEHVAGTEFVIGAMFVAWGVGTADILQGLLLGNLLAVLTWAWVCAPIAVDTRLTLYAYLEKIAGPGTVRLYSVVNGVLFCVLAGAMITVSASAVRVLFGLPAQVHWYPTDPGFVLVALVVGAVVVAIAVRGFTRVAQFAEICAPWMILMFLLGALVLLPTLLDATPGTENLGTLEALRQVADSHIWRDTGSELGFWHVAAFAWICNLAMHGGLSDMTILRFARSYRYGYFSALGMFIGHYLAWICAGVMGASAALILDTSITALDAGEVAWQALGLGGILAVMIAGWTTSNPTIYRAGLAFQSLNPDWRRSRVTAVVGIVTTVIACFPFVFTRLMDFVGIMGLTLSPVGAIIVAEHWLFPRLGWTRYWSHFQGQFTNWPAVTTWLASLLAAWLLHSAGLHLYFLLLPTWLIATLLYCILAWRAGAARTYSQAEAAETAESQRKAREREALATLPRDALGGRATTTGRVAGLIALAALLACLLPGLAVLTGRLSLDSFQTWLIWPTLVYFVSATCWAGAHRQRTTSAP